MQPSSRINGESYLKLGVMSARCLDLPIQRLIYRAPYEEAVNIRAWISVILRHWSDGIDLALTPTLCKSASTFSRR